ncbi:hypothetical protein ACWCXB_29935 [Streptomyces sp. NPDC001514]
MVDIETEIVRTYEQHQAAIRAERAKLQALPAESPDLVAAISTLEKAVDALLAYEQRIPALREEPHRALSQRIVSWTVGAQSAGTVLVGLAVIPGWVGMGWLILLVVHLLTVLSCWAQQITADRHRTQRYAALAVNALGALAGVLAFSLISAWFTVLYLIVAAVTNVVLVDSSPAAVKGESA